MSRDKFYIQNRKQIQTNKQKISSLKASNEQSRDGRMSEEIAMSRVNQRWTKDEYALAMMGFRKFGENFKVKPTENGKIPKIHSKNYKKPVISDFLIHIELAFHRQSPNSLAQKPNRTSESIS
jgi:hypothetical protein